MPAYLQFKVVCLLPCGRTVLTVTLYAAMLLFCQPFRWRFLPLSWTAFFLRLPVTGAGVRYVVAVMSGDDELERIAREDDAAPVRPGRFGASWQRTPVAAV